MGDKNTDNAVTNVSSGHIGCLIVGVVIGVLIMMISFNFPGSTKGIPLQISDLVEEGKIYVKPNARPDLVVLFHIEGEPGNKVAFLPEDCPKRFIVIDDGGTARVVSVPILGVLPEIVPPMHP